MALDDATPGVQESILGSGAGGPLTPPSGWFTIPGGLTYPSGLTIGSPTGGMKAPGSLNLQTLWINGFNFLPANYLPFVGGTMQGMLTLFADPSGPMDAVDKRYVDNLISGLNTSLTGYLPIGGGTVTGNLTVSGTTTLSADPTANLQAATKNYVDNKFSGLIAIPD